MPVSLARVPEKCTRFSERNMRQLSENDAFLPAPGEVASLLNAVSDVRVKKSAFRCASRPLDHRNKSNDDG